MANIEPSRRARLTTFGGLWALVAIPYSWALDRSAQRNDVVAPVRAFRYFHRFQVWAYLVAGGVFSNKAGNALWELVRTVAGINSQ